MTDVLTEIEQRQADRKAAAAAAWRKLIASLGDGDKIKRDAIEAVLRDTGRTVDDLRQATEAYRTRARMLDEIKLWEVAEPERPGLRKSVEDASAALAAAQEKHDAIVGPANDRWNEIDGLERRANHARRQLLDGADPEVRARYFSIESELERERSALIKLRIRIENLPRWIVEAEAGQEPQVTAGVFGFGVIPASRDDQLEQLRNELRSAKEQEPLLAKRVEELDKLRRELLQRTLSPWGD